MNRTELLNAINEALDPVETLTEETVVADCDDLDSLGLFNVVMVLKAQGVTMKLEELAMCDNVGELLDLVLTKK